MGSCRTATLVALAVLASVAVPVQASDHGSAGGPTFTANGVTASVTPTGATLSDGALTRTWTIGADGSVRTAGLGGAGRGNWFIPAPDFTLTVDGVPTSSVSGWVLAGVTPQRPVSEPGRPTSGLGASLLFRYLLGTDAASSIELERRVTLHPGAGVVETTSTLRSAGPAARVSAYSLDQVTPADAALPAEVQTFHGGSDWRDDYRQVTHPTGTFDSEGEVLRLGNDAGIFLVTQRRSGSMSRVGRDASGAVWAGVDWGRDLFDYGPLQTAPPDYNRLDNPAYPAPIRARTLPPLGTLDLGTSYLGVYAGGAQQAAATFAADFVGGAEPTFARTVGLNSFHPWNHGAGMSDLNLRRQVDAAKALGVETFMLDDQWQGGPGGESGDWQWDPARFPDANHDGIPDFVTYLHDQGMQLGLWMSPVEFNSASTTYAAHPDWACAPVGDATAQVPDDAGLGVWDATNPQFQTYLLGVIDRLVSTYDVREFKFDFMAWVDCGAHDYADYEAAFVDLVHRMQVAHPHVTFELDETNDQRCWPFESAQIGPSWFDNGHLHGSGPVAKLLHDVWSAAPWVPAWSLGVGLYDGTLQGPYAGTAGVDFLFPLAMLTHVTFWSDLTALSVDQQRETAWWIDWYKAHRATFGSTVYELTDTDPIDGKSWAAFEPWNGTNGYLFAFRQPGAAPSLTVAVDGVDPQAGYVMTDVRSGAVYGTFTGAALRHGLTLSLPDASAAVFSLTRAE